MPRVLLLIATAAILAPLAGHSAILVIDSPRDPLAIAGDDIARIVDGGDLASLIAAERAVVEMTGGRVLDYTLSGDSRATLAAGEISTVSLSDRATADFNGSFHGSRITLTGNARADVRGGYFLSGWLSISDSATAHVYGSEFTFQQGRLRGFLQDGNPIGWFGEGWGVGRTDDPLAPFRQLMPEGLCVHTGGNEYCGPTLFYSTFGEFRLQGTDRMTVVEGGSGGFIRMNGQASLDIRGGSSGFVGMEDDVRVTMRGGGGGPFYVGGRSRLEVSGGSLSTVELLEEGVAEFITRDARFNGRYLSGTWLDGTTFETEVFESTYKNGLLMPDGLCVSIAGVSHCGPTVFYRMDGLTLFAQQSVVITDGAEVSSLYLTEQSQASLRGGTVHTLWLRDDTTADMTGGFLGEARVESRGHLTMSAGEFGRGAVYVADEGRVDVVARDARFNLGRLEGEWADGTTFSIAVTTPTFDLRFMPSGMCVVRGADKFCGATLFYESNNTQFLFGVERAAMVDGARLLDVRLFQEAALDVSGGFASFVVLSGSSRLTMTGGDLGSVSIGDDGYMTMTDGRLGSVTVGDDGNAELLGGRMDQLQVGGRGLVTLSDMEGLSFISVAGLDGGHVTLKVLAATMSGGVINGTWLGGGSFSLSVYGVDDANFASKVSVVAVPEPATWLSMVLGLGALVGVRARSRAKMCKSVMTGASGMKREEEHGVA
jgi:hypothetical protein